MTRISSTRPFARPERTGTAGLQILGIFAAAAIVAITTFSTSAQAQYRGAAFYRGPYGGVAVVRGYGYRGGYYDGYYGGGYGYRHAGGYGYPRSYAGYFGPGQLGPEFGPGYYEVTVFPTTYYDLPPYEEPGYYGYRGW